MGRAFRRVLWGGAFFVATCAVGTVGYVIAGWTPIDAFYMVIITIFGVGYGEVRPVATPELRGFTIAVIVGGYAAAIYAVGGFVQLVTEGEINRALGARRMNRQVSKLRGHTIICGYGRIGRILARELADAGEALVVVDVDPVKVREADDDGHPTLAGDASREEVLHAAGIDHAKALATVLPDDATNVFITLGASGLNRGVEIIARAEDPSTEPKLRRSGATQVVLPAAIGAERVATLISRPGAHLLLRHADERSALQRHLEPMGLQFEELRLPAHSSLIGRTLDHIEVHGNRGFLIVGLRHANGQLDVNPTGDTPLAEGDTIIVLGHGDDLPDLRRRYQFERELTYRGARRPAASR